MTPLKVLFHESYTRSNLHPVLKPQCAHLECNLRSKVCVCKKNVRPRGVCLQNLLTRAPAENSEWVSIKLTAHEIFEVTPILRLTTPIFLPRTGQIEQQKR